MLFLTHLLFGLVSLSFFNLNSLFLFFCVFPDVDIPSSPVGGMFKPLSEKIFMIYGHRSLTHSLIFSVGFSLCFVSLNLFWEAFLGILSHILLDSITYSGVKFLYPKKTNYALFERGILVGSHKEFVLCVMFFTIFMLRVFLNKL